MRISLAKISILILLAAVWLVIAGACASTVRLMLGYPGSPWAIRAAFFLVLQIFVLILIPFLVVLVELDEWRRQRFASRKRLGLCVHCGYDLTGVSAECPECGKWTVRPTMDASTPAPSRSDNPF